ncbi:hypothetical protein BDV93DRAFT_610659 [Ceratobasidium sp. AG-I]|nr:hypothetical protein BDV93DRAFT_610659 [Ceratobasidium sp. AG-I]
MSNNHILDQHNVSLEFYMKNIKLFAWSFPTRAEVEAAIFAFCPFSPIAGHLLAKESVSTLRVLTTILYLPFYPEFMDLLAQPIFVAKCLMDIEKYLERYKLFDQAYGLLMLQIISLGNMVGILAQVNQLDSFINSMLRLQLSSQDGDFDIAAELVHKTASILQDKMKRNGQYLDLSFWNYGLDITIDGEPKHEGFFTAERSQYLLEKLWEQRDLMVTTFARSPAPGFSAVLLVMSSNAMKCNLAKDRAARVVGRSLDLIIRYTLVATPMENALIQGQCLSNEFHHLAPVSLDDHRATANVLTQRLLSRDQRDSFSAGHAGFMLLQFSDALRTNWTYELCIPVMEAGLKFFWRVCLHPKRREEVWGEHRLAAFEPVRTSYGHADVRNR